MDSQPSAGPIAARLTGTLAAVGIVTLIFAKGVPVNPTTAGFVYLITILLIAAAWGLWESVLASLAATLCFNFFFFPPIGTFEIANPHNWVSLIAFLVTSLIASQLSERAKRRTLEAVRRRLEMERLYALSRAILMTSPGLPFASQISEEILRIYELSGVAIFDAADGATHQAGRLELADVTGKLRQAALRGTIFHDRAAKLSVTPISLGERPIGGLALAGGTFSGAGLQALSNLIAAGLEKVRAQATAARAEAARQGQEFKSTLLDALAHEFKTPLTSIKAATSAILSNGVPKPEQQRELLTVIDQDAGRLSTLVTEAIHLARIEAGKIHPKRNDESVGDLLRELIAEMEIPLEGRTIEVVISEQLPTISVDAELFRLAIRQLVDNAAKYSPPESPIVVAADSQDGAVSIRVRNEGPGIPQQEQAKIFERFYRGVSARSRVPGSGMGLAIARDILRAHGGELQVHSVSDEGAEFIATLPPLATTERQRRNENSPQRSQSTQRSKT